MVIERTGDRTGREKGYKREMIQYKGGRKVSWEKEKARE